MKNKGAVLWFTGLSGSGKTTIAEKVYRILKKNGIECELLDGDTLRRNICKDLGFSKKDREENIKRATYLAGLLSRHGVVVLASFISPYRSSRRRARKEINNFIEVFVDTSLEVCEKRDRKGLYKKARKGEIKFFTGISDPYERPENPEIRLKTNQLSINECVSKIIEYLEREKLI